LAKFGRFWADSGVGQRAEEFFFQVALLVAELVAGDLIHDSGWQSGRTKKE
jgi:hypothetical protein